MRQTNKCFETMCENRAVKYIRGDGLSVKLDSNDHILEVTGDGCRISMARNCGSVRVVGDGCRVTIAHNTGDIEYTGDGGRVLLGPKSSKNVKYVGDGGRVSFDSAKRTLSKDEKKDEKKLGSARTNIKRASSKNRDTEFLARVENAVNDEKEQIRNKREAGKSVSKIVTMIECDGFVRKWFVDPHSVIESINGNPVKIVSNVNAVAVSGN